MRISDWSSDVCSSDLFRHLGDMTVVQGAGVGGGSLIYANISVEAEPFVFDDGWPAEITYEALKPHYETVGRMLNVQELPDNQLTERFELMRDGANALGPGSRFRKVPLAVTFDEDWHYGLDDRSEEHTSELQSLLRISYAVFYLKKKTNISKHNNTAKYKQ